jgi:hypothetical protein
VTALGLFVGLSNFTAAHTRFISTEASCRSCCRRCRFRRRRFSADFLTPKAIGNRIKAKGLQKLRWYCQV